MSVDIFEFRMSGDPHCWEGLVDIREISVDEVTKTVLLKIDGDNNKTKAREQIQFHMRPSTFEELIEGINRIMPQYKEMKKNIQ